MKKIEVSLLATMALFFCLFNQGRAQDYTTGIGLRGGPGYGLTIKHFTSPNKALEGIISPLWEGFMFTGLYQKHAPVGNANRLKYYGGIGLHVGVWNYQHKHFRRNPWVSPYENEIIAGVDLVLGIEYTFKILPFNIGLDWKPMLNLINDGSLWYRDVALSLRFIPGKM